MTKDVFANIRDDYPIFSQKVNGKSLVYLDSAATSLKPVSVSNRIKKFYDQEDSNVHRGIHYLSARATDMFEETRKSVGSFIGAKSEAEIVFTKGTTESINLVAQSYGRANLCDGDEVLISEMEHHSNIVPWQMICEEKNAKLKVIKIDDNGDVDLESFSQNLSERTKILSIVHVSNTLGTLNPIMEMCKKAHQVGAVVLVDAAQSSHCLKIDVAEIGCDFLAFSAHKMFGPHGVGVLYGKADILKNMPPWEGGGSMISEVDFSKTTYNNPPYRFEAGTPNISGVVAFREALDYINKIGIENILSHELALSELARELIQDISGIRIIGTARNKLGIISFVLEGTHPNDIGMLLDQQGVAVRTGHHCTQPLMKRFEIPATVRASFSIYNTEEDVHQLVVGIKKAKELLV